MLFNSYVFFPFFLTVAFLHFWARPAWRWLILLIASYVFYMAWKAEFALLIAVSTLVDYTLALAIAGSESRRRRGLLLLASLVINLGLLITFKYLGLLAEMANIAAAALGMHSLPPAVVEVALPVGISFYTFQTLAYTIDVYRGRIEPEPHLGRFALYVAFWPQLVAGPIERPGRLLPQLHGALDFDYQHVRHGLVRMAWGFFKKVVVADRLAPFVISVYDGGGPVDGSMTAIATVCYAFQIYCDFSGYSDIAIGAARVFGVDLMENFRTPYFAGSLREFWQRWHISLSTWFRDYLYIPLGGSRVGSSRWLFNIVLTFVISGIWHGASIKFAVWGLMHGAFILIEGLVWGREGPTSRWGKLSNRLYMNLTFHGSWLVFRAPSLSRSGDLAASLLSWSSPWAWLERVASGPLTLPLAIGGVVVLLATELWLAGRKFEDVICSWSWPARWCCYVLLCQVILWFGVWNQAQFIYYQF